MTTTTTPFSRTASGRRERRACDGTHPAAKTAPSTNGAPSTNAVNGAHPKANHENTKGGKHEMNVAVNRLKGKTPSRNGVIGARPRMRRAQAMGAGQSTARLAHALRRRRRELPARGAQGART